MRAFAVYSVRLDLFESGGAVAYIVVGVLIVLAVDLCLHQLRAGVVGEGVIHHRTLSGGIAGGGAAENVVDVGTQHRYAPKTKVTEKYHHIGNTSTKT